MSYAPELGNQRTFTEEVALVNERLANRMVGFRPQRNRSKEEQVIRAMLRHCDSSVALSPEDREDLQGRVTNSIAKGASVPVTITIAHGMRAPNPLKYDDPYGPPTFAWLFNAFVLAQIARKVEYITGHGLHFYLFEEGYLFNELFGVPEDVVTRNLWGVMEMLQALEVPATIIPLTTDMLPYSRAQSLSVEVSNAEVLAVLCSLPEVDDRWLLDFLYTRSTKPFSEIKRRMPVMWHYAHDVAVRKSQVLTLRKHRNLYPTLLEERGVCDAAKRVIDAAITDKTGRISLELTGNALFNHGAAVRRLRKKLSCIVVPEYRLKGGELHTPEGNVWPVRPVTISPWGPWDHSYIWCYDVVPAQ